MPHRIAAAALLALVGVSAPAHAFPPTATISPGYDRALAESRRGRIVDAPVLVAPPVDAPRYQYRGHRHHRQR